MVVLSCARVEEETLLSSSARLPVRAIVLRVLDGPQAGRSVAADEFLTVGTADGNDLVLEDRTASRYHLEVRRELDCFVLTDVGSKNGTSAGPVRFVKSSVRVPAGTTLTLGATRLSLDDGDVHFVAAPSRSSIPGLVGSSVALRKLVASVTSLAPQNVSVLVLGESGTGKELVARGLHEQSPRATKPFVVVDCGALSPSILSSELFGHEKGAFTGAERRHLGAFERADGGTLFLDEVGELPLEHQTALLGALERRQIRRVGGSTDIPVDVRLVTATHRDLRAAVNEGRFRLDLYYRVAVVLLRTPALREHREDIAELIRYFAGEAGFPDLGSTLLAPGALAALERHDWPGNVRELRNVVAAALATGTLALDGEIVALDPAPAASPPAPDGAKEGALEPYRSARQTVLEAFERKYLEELLARTQGNIREAARRAQMDRSHLMDLMRRHGMR